MFGQHPIGVVRDEAAQIDDAMHIGVLGGRGDVAGRGPVGIAEAGLTDRVDQVVDDVDLTGGGERLVNRLGIGGVESHGGDVVKPAHPLKPGRFAGGGQHLMPVRDQCRHQPRSHVTGRARHQNPHTPNVDGTRAR
jgi:hypothetical protein